MNVSETADLQEYSHKQISPQITESGVKNIKKEARSSNSLRDDAFCRNGRDKWSHLLFLKYAEDLKSDACLNNSKSISNYTQKLRKCVWDCFCNKA